MPNTDPDELLEEFLKYKLKQGTQGGDNLPREVRPAKTSLMPAEVYNPDGTINLGKAIRRLSSPSVLLALVVSATNLYVEYEQMKITVVQQEQKIAELKKELDHYQNDSEIFLDKTRERFSMNEEDIQALRTVVSNIQTELRIRYGSGSALPVRERQETLRDLAEENAAVLNKSRVSQPLKPLEGLKF